MKKVLSILLALVFTMSAVTGCFAAGAGGTELALSMQIGNPVMTVNGIESEIDPGRGTAPVIQNDRTLVPVRAIIEAMGGSVEWNDETQTAFLEYNGDTITLTIGSTVALLNGEANTLDSALVLVSDRTMLPIRFIAEGFGFDVKWTDSTQTVVITGGGASEPEAPAPETGTNGHNVLVVYFSMPETEDPNDMTVEEANSTVVIDGEVLGNTQYMAYVIAENMNADIFRIEPEVPYPTEHETLVDLASAEKADAARPAIRGQIENLDDYSVIFLGYPNWWGDMPMILYTFLEQYDLSGKTIVPFNTHGGSGFSNTISTIRAFEPGADVADGLSISRNSIQDAEQQIVDWVNSLEF